MPEEDLFPTQPAPVQGGPQSGQPLAERLRPRALGEIVGQDHLLGPDGSLTGM
ncbi:MAG TPA: replication-associated recombination protein A, partial [Acidocella sp.]|nr:replication-associated recombination protein A [Acidocella sp.]